MHIFTSEWKYLSGINGYLLSSRYFTNKDFIDPAPFVVLQNTVKDGFLFPS